MIHMEVQRSTDSPVGQDKEPHMNTRYAAILTAALMLSLSGCGGGASGDASPDNTAATIQAAAKAIADKLPPAKVYSGSFTIVNNVPNGFTAGTSERDVVTRLAKAVVADPTKWPELYRLLLSDAGLKISIVGESVGVSAITGYTLYAANTNYTVKLTGNGLQIN